jgi:hypothetical protein
LEKHGIGKVSQKTNLDLGLFILGDFSATIIIYLQMVE